MGQERPAGGGGAERTRHIRVLLVECEAAEADLRMALAKVPGTEFHLDFARSRAEGLRGLGENPPDVVVLRAEGEAAGGLSAIRRLREVAGAVPIVAIVGSDDGEQASFLLQEGAQDCVARARIAEGGLARGIRFALDRRVPDSYERRKMHEFKTGEARFWQLLAGYAEGIVLISKDGVVRLANLEAARLLGRPQAELMGKPFPFAFGESGRKVVEIVRGDGAASVVEVRTTETEWEWDTTWVATLRDITEQVKVEERLRKSEERYRLATRATSDVVYEWNLLTHEVARSEPFAWLFGYPPSEVAGNVDWWFERVHELDRGRLAALLDELGSGAKRAFEMEYRFRRRDGSYAVVLDRGQVVEGAGRKPLRVVGTLADISERKASEERLQASEAMLARAERIAAVGSFEWDLETGKTVWSAELYQIYGVDAATFAPSLGSTRGFVVPEDLERITEVGRRAVEKGAPFQVVYRIRRSDGTARVVYAAGSPVEGPQGGAGRYAGIVQDITERFEAEERLRESEARLAEAQRIAGLGTWEWDIAANRATPSPELLGILGAKAPDVPPTLESFLLRVHPEDRPMARRLIDEGFAKMQPFEAECRVVRPDGEVRRIFSRGDFIVGPGGDPVRMVGIALDITERYPGGPEAARQAPAREFVPAPREALRVRPTWNER